MKFIHCADIHLGSEMNSRLPDDKAKERRAEVRRAFSSMVDYAAENGVSAILMSGDVFDTDRPLIRDKEYFYSVVRAHPDIDFLYLRGNHDVEESYCEDDLGNLKTFSDKWQTYHYGNVDISGAETQDGNLPAIYASLNLDKDKINIVMLHGPTDGSDSGTINLQALKGKHIDYLALGHIHSYSANQLDKRGVYVYSGCLEGRGFDETGEKGFVVIDTDGGLSYRFVVNSRRVIREITVDISGSTDAYRACLIVDDKAKFDRKDLLRVNLTGEIAYDSDGLAKEVETHLSDRFYFVSVKDKTTRKLDISAYKDSLSLRGEFVRMVMASSYTEEEKKTIIGLGLKALSGEKF